MTKPRNFILNSDFLSIAQYDRGEFTYSIPTHTIVAMGYVHSEATFTVSTKDGVIPRIMIKRGSDPYRLGSYLQYVEAGGTVPCALTAYFSAKNTLKVIFDAMNYSSDQQTTSAVTFTIKVCCFRPPNML